MGIGMGMGMGMGMGPEGGMGNGGMGIGKKRWLGFMRTTLYPGCSPPHYFASLCTLGIAAEAPPRIYYRMHTTRTSTSTLYSSVSCLARGVSLPIHPATFL